MKVLKFNPRGLTVTDISRKTKYNRNSAAKQLGILRAEGKVDVRNIGNARVFSLAQRVPLSAFLCFTKNMILILDNNLTVVQANDQYAGLTGLPKQDLIGRNILECSLPIVSDPETLAVIRSMEKEQIITDIRFRKGKDELFYKMEVIPTTFEAGETGLTIVLDDITEKKRHLRNMEFVARTAMELVDLPPETDIYQYIAERLVELVPDNPRYYVESYDELKGMFFMKAMYSKSFRDTAKQLAGFDLVGMKFPIKEFFYGAPFFESPSSLKNMREMRFRPFFNEEQISFFNVCAGQFTREVCDAFLHKCNIGKIYMTGLVWQEQLFGIVGIALSPEESLDNRQAIESFLRQTSIAIARRITDDRLSRSEKRFAELVTLANLPAMVINPDGWITLVNPRFTGTFGYTLEDIPTVEAWHEKAFPDPEYRDETVAALNIDQRGAGEILHKAYTIQCKNGEQKSVAFRTFPLSDGTKVVVYGV